jgi:hypothetical protein
MAKTYFEYADRLPESQINWFQVGKDITDAIKKEDELRQKRKAETEAAFRKDINELANAPQGNSDLVNKWTTNYSSKTTDYLLQINKLLKAGAIKPKDYTLINQNLRDGTAILFNLSREYQAEYEEKMKRAQPDGDGSASETQIMGMIEGFGNLKDTEAVINPLDGSVSVGKLVTNKDGVKVLAEGADNLMTVNQLRNRIKQKIDKYKVNEALKGEVDLLGDVVTEMVTKNNSTTQTGFISKITDPTKRKGLSQEGQQAADAYLQTEKNIINSKLTNPYHTSSILFDWANSGVDPKTGKPYQVVFDEKLANTSSHYILYSMKEGMLQPDFDTTANGREQKKEAEKYLTNKFRSMLEQKTELKTTPQIQRQDEPEWKFRERQEAKKAEDAAGAWNQLYTGKTAAEKKAAAEILLGTPRAQQLGLIDIDLSSQPGKVLLKYVDRKMDRSIDMVDESGKPVSLRDFSSKGVELHGVEDRDKAMRAGGGSGTYGKITDYKGIRASRQGEAKPINVPLSAITEESGAASKTLQDALPSGFVVKDTGGVFGNTIEVTAPNGKTYKYTSKIKGPSADSFKKDLEKFVEENSSETEL